MKNNPKYFDIVVIGAGPAGASGANLAAQHGFSTCLIEKESLSKNGRYKACGGALDWKLIEKLDYPEEKIERRISSLELHHVDGETFSKKGEGATVWRSIFDKFLADRAVANGALLKDHEPVIEIESNGTFYNVITDKGKYQAKFILAADGVSSPTLNKLNWPHFTKEQLIVTITQETITSNKSLERNLDKNALHLFFSIKNLCRLGYAWLFPKHHIITVGWGNQLSLVKNAKDEFKKFLSLPLVNRTLKNSTLDQFKSHLIPVDIRSQLFMANIFAIGDTGGFVDPISGKGIPYAMQSGQIAVDTINSCEKKDLMEKLGEYYENKLEKDFLQLLRAKRIARDRIYYNDETLKQFLGLWEKYRSSEIVRRNLI